VILIPAHNEEKSLGTVLHRLQRYQSKDRVVVVNSCSTDQTAQIAAEWGAIVIDAPEIGYWNALCCGYRYALEQNEPFVVQMDADGQHPPHVLPRITAELQQRDSLTWVVGSRYNTGTAMSVERKLAQQFFSRLLLQRTGIHLRDVSSGFWGLSSDVIQILLDYPGQTADVVLRLYAIQQGVKIVEIPCAMEERLQGSSMHSGLTSMKYFYRIFQDLRSIS